MTYWHKFLKIFNGCFVASSVDRLLAVVVRCRHSVSLVLFRRRFPLLFFLSAIYIFLSSLGSAHVHWALSLLSIMSRHSFYCWLATSLFWYWSRLRFLKRFWKNAYPTFKRFQICLMFNNFKLFLSMSCIPVIFSLNQVLLSEWTSVIPLFSLW